MKYLNRNFIWAFLSVLLMVSCTPEEYDGPEASLLPKVSEMEATIEVSYNSPVDTITGESLPPDSAIVTFNLNQSGVVPIWIFGQNSRAFGDNYQKVYTRNGSYEVELQVYNENGVADGTKTFTFDIEGLESIDPLTGEVSKSWVMNYTVQGHIGCGPSGTEGLEWWSAGPNEKIGWGLYDDVLTFYADGTFEFDPGAGGTVYTNEGVTTYNQYLVEEGVDYEVPVDGVQQSSFERSGDQLIFPANTIVSYIPFDQILTNPVYKVVEITEDKLVLIADDGANIAWRLEFVPADSDFDVVSADNYASMLVGTWGFASNVQGHIGCGPSGTVGLEWWSAGPDEKADYGLYDDRLTFTAAGDYTYDPGEGGTVYVNAGSEYKVEYKTGDEDYEVPVEIQNSTYQIVEEGGDYYLDFPENTIVSYIANPEEFTESKYKIHKFTWNSIELISDNGVIAWHYTFKRIVE